MVAIPSLNLLYFIENKDTQDITNKKESNIEKKIIEEYSDKKNKTKPPLPYSTLNPEISSLSPSEKSNGARFVSATITKIQPNTTIF